MRERYVLKAPTDGEMLISLSLSTMSSRRPRWPMSLRASIESPVMTAASPTTTAIRSAVPLPSRAMASPSPMERPVPACPPSKTSCGLSERRGEPPMPPRWGSGPQRAGEQFGGVGRMPGAPDDAIGRAVKEPMEGHRQLHHAERAAEMAARLGHRLDDRRADLRAEL